MNWGALAATGLMCFIIALTWDVFNFWGAVLGRTIGEYQMRKLHQAEAMAQLQSDMPHWRNRRPAASYGHGTVLTGICRTCGLKVPGGGHRRECRGLLG